MKSIGQIYSDQLNAFSSFSLLSIEFIPDESGIFQSLETNKIHLWDTATMGIAESVKLKQSCLTSRFRKNGKQIAIGTKSNGIIFYDIKSGSKRAEIADSKLSERNIYFSYLLINIIIEGPISCIEWSKNNDRWLAVGFNSNKSKKSLASLRIYDVRYSKSPILDSGRKEWYEKERKSQSKDTDIGIMNNILNRPRLHETEIENICFGPSDATVWTSHIARDQNNKRINKMLKMGFIIQSSIGNKYI